MRFFFHHLYHSLAWSYDLVAWSVSLGKWDTWVASVLPFVTGPYVLELGHGPGHLQVLLRKRGYCAIGLDESAQMGRLARRTLRRSEPADMVCLVRGLAGAIPLPGQAVDTVVATFPSEYIGQMDTLAEIHRTLKPDGRLVVLISSQFTGNGLLTRLARLLFQVTGQSPAPEGLLPLVENRLQATGFRGQFHQVAAGPDSHVLIVVAQKTLAG
ncbi:MAG: methyltransferase domain-containing protein [Anaerolineaceae bacterium]|jgi:ubiquinone/menaquinone biosynthesis C-methylase UbiE|nr:methyltransferase domain-containing protein [Anaerolineaceae bacterium]